MKNRYKRVFALPDDLYMDGAPVMVSAGTLLLDQQTGDVLAQLKLQNISGKTVQAVKVKLTPCDMLGEPLGAPLEQQYLDLAAARDGDFGSRVAVPFADRNSRSYQVEVTAVAFADRSIWKSPGGSWEPLPAAETLESALMDRELVKQYKLSYGSKSCMMPVEHRDLWRCCCGAINHAGEKFCHRCGVQFAALKAFDADTLRAACEERLAEEQRLAEERRLAEEQRRAEEERRKQEQREAARIRAKKTGKIAAIAAAVLAVCLAGALLAVKVLIPNNRYDDAAALMAAGDYPAAIEAFAALDGYKDSDEQIKACRDAMTQQTYQSAVALQEAGQYAEAMAVFAELEDYQDSEARIEACQIGILEQDYAAAAALMDEGAYTAAAERFAELGDYRDSKDRLAEAEAGMETEAAYDEAAAAMAAGEYEEARKLWFALEDYRDSREQYALCGVELEWQGFRRTMDANVQDLTAAETYLENLQNYDLEQARQYRDEGWYELTEAYYQRGLPADCARCMAEIAAPSRFADFETLTEEVRLLDLYVQAKEITVTNQQTRNQLEDLLDQLPEDYRQVADLRKRIEEYDKAAAEAEKNPDSGSDKPSAGNEEVELEITIENLVGRWGRNTADYETVGDEWKIVGWVMTEIVVLHADGTYEEYHARYDRDRSEWVRDENGNLVYDLRYYGTYTLTGNVLMGYAANEGNKCYFYYEVARLSNKYMDGSVGDGRIEKGGYVRLG